MGIAGMPEIPIVSQFRYTCRYCIRKICIPYMLLAQNLQEIPTNFTEISTKNIFLHDFPTFNVWYPHNILIFQQLLSHLNIPSLSKEFFVMHHNLGHSNVHCFVAISIAGRGKFNTIVPNTYKNPSTHQCHLGHKVSACKIQNQIDFIIKVDNFKTHFIL